MAWHYSAVLGLAVACYTNALHGEFVHDDVVAVTRNPDVLGTVPLAQLFVNDFWGTSLADPTSHKSYRPLTTLTFRLNHWLGGLQPVWFHVINMALHAASCVLLTRLALSVARLDTRFATVAGLLFAAHPIHTEAVSGVVGRADVLACVLFLLSFLAYHDEGWRMKDGPRLLCSCLLAALAMLAKETGFTVLLVNLAYDLFKTWPQLKRAVWEARWNDDTQTFYRRGVKVLIATCVLLVFRLTMLRGSLPNFSSQDNPTAFHPCPHVRALTFSYLAAFNWWLLLCPSSLSHDWQVGSIPLVTSLSDARNIATALFIGGGLVLLYRTLWELETQRHPPLVLGTLLLVVPFLPATNLLFTVGFVVAERLLYIPSAGAVLLVSYGAQRLYKTCRPAHRTVLCLSILLLGASFTYKTINRNKDWSSRESLVRAGLKTLPHNAKMHYNLANYLRDSHSPQLAVHHYRQALRLWPGYASAHNNLGTLMSSASEAESHFRAAIAISPQHVNAHYNLGQVYRKMNRTAEAVVMLEQCLRLDTSYSPAYLLLARLSPPPTAARLLRHVTSLLPHSPDYQAYYAAWMQSRGITMEAQNYYIRALRLQNNHLLSFMGMSKSLRSTGQIARLHQFLIRWYLMHRDRGGPGRLVSAAELYVRSHDLYRPAPTTTPVISHTDNTRDDKNGSPWWWQGIGSNNRSCVNQRVTDKLTQVHLEVRESELSPARLCLDKSEQPNR